MKRNLLILSFLLSAVAAEAVYKMGESEPVKVDGQSKSTMKKTKKFKFPPLGAAPRENPEEAALNALSDQYSIPLDRLDYFRSLHHGYEEIVPALIVAREAQVEAGQVLQLRVKNQSWKTIAETYHVELKPLNEEVMSVIGPLRKRLPKKIMTERPSRRE